MHVWNGLVKGLVALGLKKRTHVRSLTEDLLKALPAGEKAE
jgi:hypothetical protein